MQLKKSPKVIRGFFITFKSPNTKCNYMETKEIDFLDVILYKLLKLKNPITLDSLVEIIKIGDIVKGNYKQIDGIADFAKTYFKVALNKLHKDGFVDYDFVVINTHSGWSNEKLEAYTISFEGIIFANRGGYYTELERSQIERNERRNLDQENKLLREEQRYLAKVTVNLTWVVALAAVLPSVYAFFQILEYFGINFAPDVYTWRVFP